MYNNIIKSLLAVAPLAMAAAAERRVQEVTGDQLHDMSLNQHSFQMSADETLVLTMTGLDNDNPPHWELARFVGAKYTVSDPHWMCGLDSCDLAWDINYAPLNDHSKNSVVDAKLHFIDLEGQHVKVGLTVHKEEPVRPDGRLMSSGLRGGLSECTQHQKDDVLVDGAHLIPNSIDEQELLKCDKQVMNGLYYYASFQDEGMETVTQALFKAGEPMTLQCAISGLSADADWQGRALRHCQN